MTEIDTLKSKVAKQRNEIARLEQKIAQLAVSYTHLTLPTKRIV